jgi:transposase
MYDQGMDARQVAGLLRVSTKPAYQWRRAWASGGEAALASRGPGGTRTSGGRWPGSRS